MRSAFASRLRGLQDLAVGVLEGLRVKLFLDRNGFDFGRLSEAEKVIVQHRTDGSGCDLIEVHFGIVKYARNGVGCNVDAVIVQIPKV